jgi:hypothetical protein
VRPRNQPTCSTRATCHAPRPESSGVRATWLKAQLFYQGSYVCTPPAPQKLGGREAAARAVLKTRTRAA